MRPIIKPPISARLNTSDPMGRGLAFAYLFNEGGGSKAFDMLRRYDGTVAASWTASGLNFNGVANVVSVPSYVLGTNFTFYIVFKPKNVAGDSYQTLASQGTSTGFWFRNGGRVDFFYGGDHLNNTVLSQDVWHHYACTNRAGAATFYLNGRADGSSASAPGFTLTHIGDDPGSETFTGEIACILIWDRALTAAEIEALWVDPFAIFRSTSQLAKASAAVQTINAVGTASTAANGVASLRLKLGAAGTASTAANGAAALKEKIGAAGTGSTSANGVGSERLRIVCAGTASTAANGTATLSFGGSPQTINAVGTASTAANGVASLRTKLGATGTASSSGNGAASVRLRISGAGTASTTQTGTAHLFDASYQPTWQELEIWIGEAGDSVAALDDSGESAAEMLGEGETVAEVEEGF